MIIWKYMVYPHDISMKHIHVLGKLLVAPTGSVTTGFNGTQKPPADRPKTVPVNLPQHPGAEASNYSTSATQQSRDALKPWGIGEIGNIVLPETLIIGDKFYHGFRV